MSRRSLDACVLLLSLVATASVHAAPPASVKSEIDYLLAKIGDAKCEFYRNGTWYDGARAVSHLQFKYGSLVSSHLISTTDDFIERAGSRSSLTGEAYMIRCGGGAPVTCATWLRMQLAAYRDTSGALRDTRH